MRYRPFGRSGAAVSAVSLVLTDAPMRGDDRIKLIYAALEAGINTFEIQGRDPQVAQAVGEALSAIERRMVFVALRVGWGYDRSGHRVRDLSAEGVTGAIEALLARTRLGHLDVALLDILEGERLPTHIIPALRSARAAGRVSMLGVAGSGAADPHIGTGEFDVLATAFNIQSGWLERNRIKRATQCDMAIMGCDYHPPGLGGVDIVHKPAPGPLGLGRLLGSRRERIPSAYDFLEQTPGWTAEQICLGYALTEPSLATVQTPVRDADQLNALTSVVERDLPTGLAAQIEMARFSTDQENAALAKRRAGA
jgi:aryl-alcohol dehydrogenase-like predicted oxidoreductase